MSEGPLVLVAASRMVWEPYDHARNRDGKRGDINAAYSADKIAMSGSCKCFTHERQLYTVVSMGGRGNVDQACAYKLVPLNLYQDVSHTYNEMRGQFTYNSMRVKCGKETFVMVGPAVTFRADLSIPDYTCSDSLFDLPDELEDEESDDDEAYDRCEECGELFEACQCDETIDHESEPEPVAVELEDVEPVSVAPIAAEPEQLGLF